MKARPRRRLSLESLETRYALATGAVVSGNLTISETAVAADLLIEQVAADTWEVSASGTPITGSPFTGVTGNVIVRTGSAADQIEIDLNGFAVPKCLIVSAGGGDNVIDIYDGEITKTLDVRVTGGADDLSLRGVQVGGSTWLNLGHGDNHLDIEDSAFNNYAAILTGNGNDNVTLGDGLTPVTFACWLKLQDCGGPTDTLQINDLVAIDGKLAMDNWNEVAFAAGAEAHSHFYYNGGYNVVNELVVAGTIDGGLYFYGNKMTDLLTLEATSTIGRSVTAYMGAGNDVATFAGVIGTTLGLDAQAGNDTVYLGGTVNIRATIYLGTGADNLYFTGEVGTPLSTGGRLLIDAGSGLDRVEIEDNSAVNGQLLVNMAADNDIFYLSDLAYLVSGSINGGSGTDGYYGTRPRLNVIDMLFEVFGASPP